jgi:hypothetical protein
MHWSLCRCQECQPHRFPAEPSGRLILRAA